METSSNQNKTQSESLNNKREVSESTSSKNLSVIIIGLILILGVFSLLLFTLQSESKPVSIQDKRKLAKEQSPPKNTGEFAPKKHLSGFVKGYLADYYKPATIQPEKAQENTWKYKWSVDEEKLLSFIAYNQKNNHLNRKVVFANITSKEAPNTLSQEASTKLSSQIYGLTGSNWQCGQMTVELKALPDQGSIPLKNVDLKTKITGDIDGETTYQLDCESDGKWDKTITTNKSTYKAKDLCSYSENREYSATVKATRGQMVLIDTTDPGSKTASRCVSRFSKNNQKIELILSKLKSSQNVTAGLCLKGPQSSDYDKNTCLRN